MSQYIRLLGKSVVEAIEQCTTRPPPVVNPMAIQRSFSSNDDCHEHEHEHEHKHKHKEPECPTGKEHTCAVKDANRHKRAKPKPCPPRYLIPAIPPWCTLPHLKHFGKKKIKVEKDPCHEGDKCPHDEGIAYRRFKRAEERNFKETMEKRVAADKKLDEELKKAKKRMKKPMMKDTFTCIKDPEGPPKCGKH